MGSCGYCKGAIDDDAVKCRHCGEWVDKRAGRRARGDLHPVVKAVAVIAMAWVAWLVVANWWG